MKVLIKRMADETINGLVGELNGETVILEDGRMLKGVSELYYEEVKEDVIKVGATIRNLRKRGFGKELVVTRIIFLSTRNEYTYHTNLKSYSFMEKDINTKFEVVRC